MHSKSRILYAFLSLILIAGLFSCVPQKRVKYLQTPEGASALNSFENKTKEYLVQPGDYLYIRLFTSDNDVNAIFSDMTGISTTNNIYEQSIYLTSYLVNDSGYISLPLLGQVKASGITTREIEEKLFELMLKDITNPGVIVRLTNFRVSILGEVKNPGTYSISQHRANIFQVLSLANDLTTYSNRNSVKLLRKKGDQTIIIDLDLTKRDIISSEYFYLQPNDIIYVEPLKYKQYAFEAFPYALILSSLSTILALMTFFRI